MEGQDTFEKEIALAAVLLSEQEKYNISPVNSQATTSYWQMTAWKEQMRS
jgi:hypothetical protein